MDMADGKDEGLSNSLLASVRSSGAVLVLSHTHLADFKVPQYVAVRDSQDFALLPRQPADDGAAHHATMARHCFMAMGTDTKSCIVAAMRRRCSGTTSPREFFEIAIESYRFFRAAQTALRNGRKRSAAQMRNGALR